MNGVCMCMCLCVYVSRLFKKEGVGVYGNGRKEIHPS